MSTSAPPISVPMINPATGTIDEVWRRYFRDLGATVAALAPLSAPYWLSTSNAILTGELNMGALGAGYLKQTVALGVAAPSAVATIPQADITGLVAALAALTASIAAFPVLTFGVYTPTLFNVANLSASLAYACQWLRVGSTVTVSGRVDADPIAVADTQLGISLPVASNFANSQECAGTGATLTTEVAAILADTVNDRAVMRWTAGDLTNAARLFAFTYQVI